MKALLKSKPFLAAVLVALGLLTRFIYFGQPNEVVLDEVYFNSFVSSYYTHEYYFDIHPPLGKLLIAGFAAPFGYHPGAAIAQNNVKYADDQYKILRFLPSLAGSFLALVIFGLALELGLSLPAAFVAGLLTVFDNALIVQSRFILLDSFLLLFGFSSLWCYLRYRHKHRLGYLIGFGLLAGAAASIKWTGLTFIVIAAGLEVYHFIKNRKGYPWAKIWAGFIVLPLAVYMSTFWVHFALLNKTGQGDAFMSPSFQKTLQDNPYQYQALPGISFVQKFIEINQTMYTANQGIKATHPYSSKWYSWPLMLRPMLYWVGPNKEIYSFGNPVIWWLSTISVAVLAGAYAVRKRIRHNQTATVLLAAYAINLLPFIAITRVMFIYHYFTALLFAILALVFVVDRTPPKWRQPLWLAIPVLAIAAFLFFSPLTYGLNLSPQGFSQHFWLTSWR